MKKIIITIIICFTIFITACNSLQFISQDAAMNAVKQFEADESLQLAVDSLDKIEGYSEWEHEYFYTVNLIATPDPGYSWEVNAITGEVFFVSYSDREPEEYVEVPNGNYTQAQCRQIALEFIEDKYADFNNMGFQLVNEEWDGFGWSFGWNQFLQNGAETSNFINININSISGMVKYYNGTRLQILPSSSSPQLTPQQVLDIAVQYFGITSQLTNEEPSLRANPEGLFFTFEVKGMDANDEWQEGLFEIDANNGNIINCHSCYCGSKVISKTKLGSLKTIKLPSKQQIDKIKIVKSYATFNFNKKTYKLNNGSDMLLSGSKKYKMSGKCIFKKDGVYVPGDFTKTLLSSISIAKPPIKPVKSKSI